MDLYNNIQAIKMSVHRSDTGRSDLIANRLDVVMPSAAFVMNGKAIDLKNKGHNVISLAVGEPDFDTPENIREAGKRAIDQGKTRYTKIDGTSELKQAVIIKLKRENDLDYKEEQIIVSNGAKQILFNALFSTINPDDEVIVIKPYWTSYPDMGRLAGAKVVEVNTRLENDFKLQPEDLERAITDKTKWLIFNAPSNPSGVIYTYDEMKAISAVLLKHPHVYSMSDDIYEHIVYEGLKSYSLPEIEPRLKERCLVVNGVSKAYCMTGWRIGYGAGPVQLIKAMSKVQSQSTASACAISQAAAIEALLGKQDYISENTKIFEKRRNLVLEKVSNIKGLKCNKPLGAFYLFVSCQDLIGMVTPRGSIITDDVDFTTYLLESQFIATVPGSAFGSPNFFRISYALDEDHLTDACNRLKKACDGLMHKSAL